MTKIHKTLWRFLKLHTAHEVSGCALLDSMEHDIHSMIERRNELASQLAKEKRISISQSRVWQIYGERVWPEGYDLSVRDM